MAGFHLNPVFSGVLRLSLTCGLMLVGTASVWAQGVLDSLEYRHNELILNGGSAFPTPRWETWQSTVGSGTTRMIVVDLPDVTGDLNRLKARLAEIERANPRFTRLLLLPMTNGNLRLVMEITEPAGQHLTPRVEKTAGNEITVYLKAEDAAVAVSAPTASPQAPLQVSVAAQESSGKSSPELRDEIARLNRFVASLSQDLDQLRRENKILASSLDEANHDKTALQDQVAELQRNGLASGKAASGKASARSDSDIKRSYDRLRQKHEDLRNHLEASIQENIKLQRKLEAASGGKTIQTEDPAKTLAMVGQLQATTDERDDLLQQMQDLKRIMGEQDATIDALRHQISEQTDMIRTSDPTLGQVNLTDSQINASLRSALLRVATQLKQAQAELDSLRGKSPVSSTKQPDSTSAAVDEPVGVMYTDEKRLVVSQDGAARLQSQPNAPDATVTVLQRRIQQNPAEPDSYMTLSQYYQQQRNYSGAEAVLQELLANNARYAPAYFELTRLYLLQQRPERAQIVLQTYRRLSPQDTQRIHTLEQIIASQLSKESRP